MIDVQLVCPSSDVSLLHLDQHISLALSFACTVNREEHIHTHPHAHTHNVVLVPFVLSWFVVVELEVAELAFVVSTETQLPSYTLRNPIANQLSDLAGPSTRALWETISFGFVIA